MQSVHMQRFTNSVVDMDGKSFTSCEFVNCTLRYKGGECEWDKYTTFSGCSLALQDAAQRTARFLQHQGVVSGSGFF